ncbi:MAG TPA: GMC family oxidoreductase [Actinomycetota bacterium]
MVARDGLSERDIRCLECLARVLLPEGHGLPGAGAVDAIGLLDEQARSWDPTVRKRVRWLVRVWELAPVASPRLRPFSALSPVAQRDWTEASYRSRRTWRRLVASALKQLVFLAWALAPEAEDALGYDYRCRRDDEPHGSRRPLIGVPRLDPLPSEPDDYHRTGPAVVMNAVPLPLMQNRTFDGARQALPLETISWPSIGDGARVTTDVVVIGSGAGGAVVAATLAEAGLDVVVVEEGEHVTAERDFVGPVFERFQRFCRDNGTTQVLGVPPIPLPLGKVVGGTTVVNSGTCFRAPDRVLDRWSLEHGVRDARPDELAAYYEPIEEFLHVRPVPWELLGPNGMAAHRGAVALGYSGGPLLRNIADCHGCGQCAFGCPTDAKQAMHISYLPRAQRAGARIYSRARVRRIEHGDGCATGVKVELLDDRSQVRGEIDVLAGDVVVCAGAVHTPVLLHGSGVPDPSRATGRHLRIHPATGVGGWLEGDYVSWKGTLQSYYIDAFFESHELMFEATTTVPGVGAGSIPGMGERAMKDLGAFSNLLTLGFYVSDTSSGRVRRLPNGDAVATYRLNALDARRMSLGIAVAAEVLLEAGASRVHPGVPGLDTISARADVEQLRERSVKPAHLRLTAFHPMGTARMGSDPDRSVVDSWGRHHAMSNLWVADASVFPSCVGVNPQMTIMAFAKRTAETIAAARGATPASSPPHV